MANSTFAIQKPETMAKTFNYTPSMFLKELSNLIDITFNRTDRTIKISPDLLKEKINVLAIGKHFGYENVKQVGEITAVLVVAGLLTTNTKPDERVNSKTYFIPTSEL